MNELPQQLIEDFHKVYNQQMADVYRDWSTKYNVAELRLLYLTWLTNHISIKTVQELNKKIATKKMLKEMQSKLEELK